MADLPQPYATESAGNGPKVVPKPEGVWPLVPQGFKVELYSKDVDGPRMIRTAPNGDYVVTESMKGQVTILHGMTADGKAEKASVYATGLNRPFGIAFYPKGPNPQWLYIGNTDAVVRFPYKNGDLWRRPSRNTSPIRLLMAARALDARCPLYARRQEDAGIGRLRLECG